MAHPRPGSGSFQQPLSFMGPKFDIFEWHPHLLSCTRYFLDHAQHSAPIQSLAAFINIQLPFQRTHNPIFSSKNSHADHLGPGPSHLGGYHTSFGMTSPHMQGPMPYVSLVPYIRRLVVTGIDNPEILHGFFGDDWAEGIGALHESERRNFMFACKSDNWLRVKTCYDMEDGQTVPFLQPPLNVTEKEIQGAEARWSEWLAMQDWMLGPRAPGAQSTHGYGRVNIKREPE